jgi:hypothetical protein
MSAARTPRPAGPVATGTSAWSIVTPIGLLAFLGRSVVGMRPGLAHQPDATDSSGDRLTTTSPVRATTPGWGMLPGS